MNGDMHRHRTMIDASGMGFLPGIGIAFAVVLLAIAAVLLESWWIAGGVLIFLLTVTAVIAYVIIGVISDEDD